tara:strand:- start:6209 stop:7906 length:1698 start_codon:yes stop_codon:yes gene_type:complete
MSIKRFQHRDTDITNFTTSELMATVELTDLDPTNIRNKTDILIQKYKIKDPILSAFFTQVRSQLLLYIESNDTSHEEQNKQRIVVDNGAHEGYQNMGGLLSNPSNNNQQTDWDDNQYLQQKNTNQTDKITNRQQITTTFANNHVPMKRAQVATTDTYSVPVKQDSLNPNLKNTITRFVNLDSQFRKYSNGVDCTSTNYTLDLSDTLKDAISLRLFSFQIPLSWYAIDSAYGNTCFWIINTDYNVPVYIPSGNYTPSQFILFINKAFVDAGFILLPDQDPATYNINNGKLTLYLSGMQYNPTGENTLFTVSNTSILLFFDFSFKLLCANNCFSRTNYHLNTTLGWLMGYRLPYIHIHDYGNEAPSILDLNGTKYLILVLDDFNQNHINNSLVSISTYNNVLKLPKYYSNDLTFICQEPTDGGLNNLPELIATDPSNGLLIGGKYDQTFTKTQTIIPSAPRQLTQSQIYTINEIIKNKNNGSADYLAQAPTSGDILALLPVKTGTGVSTGTLLIEFSGSIQENKRVYFGPVDIDRMALKLLDDKGNILNLNGNDWVVSLACDLLYQY